MASFIFLLRSAVTARSVDKAALEMGSEIGTARYNPPRIPKANAPASNANGLAAKRLRVSTTLHVRIRKAAEGD